MKNNEIVLLEKARKFHFNIPSPKDFMASRTVKAIENAWMDCAILDNVGQLWIDKEKVHSILRTNKANARYLISKINECEKLCLQSKEYIKGTEIGKIIDSEIQRSNTIKREEYLKYSEEFYKSIRDCDRAKTIRKEFSERLNDNRKKLKRLRIKKHNINKDELTNEVLKAKTAEFSHIRSVAVFPYLATDIENGLIVNKVTHKIITKEGINDEDELLELCFKLKWNTKWYEEFCNRHKGF